MQTTPQKQTPQITADKIIAVLKERLVSLAPKTWDEALDVKRPSLSKIEIKDGRQKCEQIIAIIIDDLVRFFNLKITINDEQLAFTSELIFDKYKHYSVSQLLYFSRMVKSAEIGKVYDRIDGAMIMEWLQIFDERRADSVKQAFDKRYAKTQRERLDADMEQYKNLSPEAMKQVDWWINHIRQTIPKSYPGKRNVSASKTYSILSEFDKLYFEQLQGELVEIHKRTVNISGKHYNQVEFVKLKLSNL